MKADEPSRLSVEVSDTNHAVRFDGSTLSVTYQMWRREEWAKRLSPGESAFLRERIDNVPLQSLRDAYEDKEIWDGFRLNFVIQKAGAKLRRISASNEFVPELAELTEALDVLMPPEARIAYREWYEARKRMDAEDP